MPEAQTTTRQAPLLIRRDAEIYDSDGGWVRSRWHFSFDRYHDPENMGIGYLRVFNDDILEAGADWPMHPHRDVEGITYVPSGHFRHADSLGNGGILEVGAVQRMTLGSGAYHAECNASKTEPVRFIQMWIMPDEKGLEPGVEQKQYTEEDRHNRLLQILRPAGAEGDGVTVHQDVGMFVSRLDPEREVEYVFSEGRGGYFYVIDGDLELNGERMKKGDAAKVLGDGSIQVKGIETSELIFIDTPV